MARSRTREHEDRYVHATNDEDQTRYSHDADTYRKLLAYGRMKFCCCSDRDFELFICFGLVALQPRCDGVHNHLCALDRHTFFQSSDHCQPGVIASKPSVLLRLSPSICTRLSSPAWRRS